MEYKNGVEKQVNCLLAKYRYCSLQGNCLYWTCGKFSGRIATIDIDMIEFQAKKAILHSLKGSDFGYHEVVFMAEGASYTEVLSDVFYYGL